MKGIEKIKNVVETNAEKFFSDYAKQDEGALLFLNKQGNDFSFHRYFLNEKGKYDVESVTLKNESAFEYFNEKIISLVRVFRVNDSHISFSKVA